MHTFPLSRRFALVVASVFAVLAVAGTTWAQTAQPVPVRANTPTATQVSGVPTTDGQGVDIQADRFSYDALRRLVLARGNVKVARGTDWVTADEADVDTANQIVVARGNIELHYGANVWKGENVTYNFKTGQGDFGSFELYSAPFNISAVDSQRVSPSVMELDDVILTTCDLDDLEYSIRSSHATIESNRIIRARNVRFQLGPVPFFWFPYVKADVNDFANFEFTPGYSSRMGAFLLSAYNYPLSPNVHSHTRFDVRSARGIGIGEDLTWKEPGGAYQGDFGAYYAHDNKPWKNDKEKAQRSDLADKERYRIHLTDRHSISDRDIFFATVNYVSDPWLLKDFFDDEYQHGSQPENRLALSHHGDIYTAGLELNLRLNDFYNNVNRLPEAFLNFNRQQLFGTPLYYEGENKASFLQRVYADDGNDETKEKDDYDAFRVDTYHMFYLPTRLAFLSVVPRAGYRGTYYSKTRVATTVTNLVPKVDEATGMTNIVEETEVLLDDGDADFRSLPEFGVESSFKAFGLLMEGPLGLQEDHGLRHVFEPYVNYTFRPTPDLEPQDLWQFDKIDGYTGVNTLVPGMRNYIQTKTSALNTANILNLIYADTYATFNMDPDEEEEEETFESADAKVELRPLTWLLWEGDVHYDHAASKLTSYNTRVRAQRDELFAIAAEYRYKLDSREQVAADVTLFPEMRWQARTYVRYDIADSHLDEHGYYLIHRTKCLGIGAGIRIRPDYSVAGEDDYSFWIRVWPLAFPSFMGSMPN